MIKAGFFLLLAVPLFISFFPVESSPLITSSRMDYSREDLESYPDGGSLHYFLEYRSLSTIVSNIESNGFSETERTIASRHTSSIYWQRYYLRDLSLNDPMNPGQAFLRIPFAFLGSLGISPDMDLFAGGYGTHFYPRSFSPGVPEAKATTSYLSSVDMAFPLGGASWMPRYTFDREPATEWGAAENARKFSPSGSFHQSILHPYPSGGQILAGAEGLFYQRKFQRAGENPQYPHAPESYVYSESSRATAMLDYSEAEETFFTFLYQYQQNDHDGAEFFLKPENTRKTQSHAVHLSGGTRLENGGKTWKIQSGLSVKNLQETMNSGFVFRTLEDSVNEYSPILPEKNGTSLTWETIVDIYEQNSVFLLQPDFYEVKFWLDNIAKKESYPGNMVGEFYGSHALYLTRYDNPSFQNTSLFHLHPSARWDKKKNAFEATGSVGVLMETAPSVYRMDPSLSVDGRYKVKESLTLVFGMAHDPVPVTSTEADFLDKDYLSGYRYFWSDNNANGIYDTADTLTVKNATGSDFHGKDAELKMPVSEKFRLGVEVPLKKEHFYTFLINGRYFRNLLTVEMDEESGVVYSPMAASTIPGGIIYNRTDTQFGNEKYILKNSDKPAFLLAFETQLIKNPHSGSIWFYEILLGAYYSEATLPMGTGPFYNDVGYYSESTTNPNSMLTAWARPDYDRAYVIHIMGGFSFARWWKLSGILRYRDGEPIGYYTIADGLNQGAEAVQTYYRSKPDKGMPRLTYAMSLDMRLAFTRKTGGNKFAAYLDIYNLLNSRTEIREYLLENDYLRDPLETNMERSVRLRLEYAF